MNVHEDLTLVGDKHPVRMRRQSVGHCARVLHACMHVSRGF